MEESAGLLRDHANQTIPVVDNLCLETLIIDSCNKKIRQHSFFCLPGLRINYDLVINAWKQDKWKVTRISDGILQSYLVSCNNKSTVSYYKTMNLNKILEDHDWE